MSDKHSAVEITEETRDDLRELRVPGETEAETLQRVVRKVAREDRVLYSLFTVFAVVGALAWILTFALVGESVANVVGGLFIASTLFWVVWREVTFRGVV